MMQSIFVNTGNEDGVDVGPNGCQKWCEVELAIVSPMNTRIDWTHTYRTEGKLPYIECACLRKIEIDGMDIECVRIPSEHRIAQPTD